MLFSSIANQTMSPADFELIFIDHYYWARKQAVVLLDYSQQFPVIKHASPDLKDDVYANASGWNAGLRLAEGELVTYIVDFCWLPENFLEYHWRFYQEHGRSYSLSVYVDRYKYPAFTDGISNDPFAAQGLAAMYPISIFKEEFDDIFAEQFFVRENLIYQERKGGIIGDRLNSCSCHEMPGEKIYLIGDTVPLRVMKTLNGWDQRYNGGYGANDIDIGVRANMLGWKWAVDSDAPILKKLGDKSVAHQLPTIMTRMLRPDGANEQIFYERMRKIQSGEESIAVPEGFGAWR